MAGFTSTIRAVLEMDLNPFKRAAAQAPGIAGEMAKQLKNKLGTGDVTKALLASLAIDSKSIAENIAAAIQGGSEEGWQKALEAAKRYDEAVKEMIRNRMSPEQRIASIRDEARLADQESREPRRDYRPGGLMRSILGEGGTGLINRLGWFGAESESDTTTRSKDAARRAIELRAEARKEEEKLQDERQKGITEYDELTQKIIDTRRSNAFDEASDAETIRMLNDDIAAAQYAVTVAVTGTIERREAELKLVQKEGLLSKENAKQKEKADEKARDALDAIIDKTEDALQLDKKRREAAEDLADAQKKLADASNDRLAFTVDQAAAGERGNALDRRRARRIQRLEREARRAYDRGDQVTESRDQRGNVVRETGEERAKRLQQLADDQRASLGNRLTSSERDRLETQKKAYKDALENAATLKNIEKYLQPMAVPKPGSTS